MKAIKNSIVAILLTLMVVIVLQNTEAVDTKLLFMTLSMPRALLLFITLATGIVIGLVFGTKISPAKTKD